jgi:enterochelin esterase-like enzyme
MRFPASVILCLVSFLFPQLAVFPASAGTNLQLEWVTPAVPAPRVTQGFFDSRAGGVRVSYHVYLPAAYTQDAQRRFPVVYWLHGSGGGVAGIRRLSELVDNAIAAGQVQPFIVVFVNGLKNGMYVDWKDGSAPLETMIVRELVPHVDATYRTIATREGRLLDGFSMGGYGAARFGFKFPELFAHVSIMGAGPLQADLEGNAPRKKMRAADVLEATYGGDPAYFLQVSPRTLAAQNARAIAQSVRVRMVIGSRDETFANNQEFHELLNRVGIPHEWIVLDGVRHNALEVLAALGDRHWAFYRAAFAAGRP